MPQYTIYPPDGRAVITCRSATECARQVARLSVTDTEPCMVHIDNSSANFLSVYSRDADVVRERLIALRKEQL